MNIFSLASAGANLTPGQRAFLKVIQALVIQALALGLAAGLSAIALYVIQASTGVSVDYIVVLRLFGVAAGMAIINSFGHGLAKYLSAQGEAPLAVAVETVTNAIGQRVAQTPALSSQVPLSQLNLSRSSVVSVDSPAVLSATVAQPSIIQFDLSGYPVVPPTVTK
jgi:hypothetical protein